MPDNRILQPLQFETFEKLCRSLFKEKDGDFRFLHQEYCAAVEGFAALGQNSPAISAMPLNHVQLIFYLYNEHRFNCASIKDKTKEELEKDEKYSSLLVATALDKYVTNEHLRYQQQTFSNRYNPEISTISLYLNFILGMLRRYKKNDPSKTLIIDVLVKAFEMCKCIVLLLTHGYETQAFNAWRTLHENECILNILVRYGEPAIKAYLKHMQYAMAFRGGLGSKEKTDACFTEIKEGMKEAGLKSKDMKRYIEYGWLLGIPGISEMPDFRLNFRDGTERVAGLHAYSKAYEMSSEVAHSSPLLIYSRKTYFYLVTMINLYESFFRLEKIFSAIYLPTAAGEEGKKTYAGMRNLYFPQLLTVLSTVRKELSRTQRKKPKSEESPVGEEREDQTSA